MAKQRPQKTTPAASGGAVGPNKENTQGKVAPPPPPEGTRKPAGARPAKGATHGLRLRATLIGVGRLNLGLMGPLFRSAGFDLILVNLLRKEQTAQARQDSQRRVGCLQRCGHYLLEVVGATLPQQVDCAGAYAYDVASPSSGTSMRAVEAAANSHVIVSAVGTGEKSLNNAAQFLLHVARHRIQKNIDHPLDICSADNPVGRAFGTALLRNVLRDVIYSEPDVSALSSHLRCHVLFPLLLPDRICSDLYVNQREELCVRAEQFNELYCGANSHYFEYVQRFGGQGVKISSFELELARILKLSMLSCAHALAAYVGALENPSGTIADALQKPEVYNLVNLALVDVGEAHFQRSGWSAQAAQDYRRNTMSRIGDPRLRDPIERVARDPIRKLGRYDRLVGTACLALYNTGEVSDRLAFGIASALAYARDYPVHGKDEQARSLQQMLNAQPTQKPTIATNPLRDVLVNVCELAKGSDFSFGKKMEESLIARIEHFYGLL